MQSEKPTSSAAATKFGDRLETKLTDALHRIEESGVYQSVADPQVDPRYLVAVVKYVLLEVFSYGPHVTEATFTAIGRLPRRSGSSR